MQIKKMTALILAFVLSVTFAACGSSQTVENNTDQTDNTTTTTDDSGKTAGSNPAKTAGSDNTLILYFSANNSKDVDATSSATPMTAEMSSVEWIADIIHDRVGGDLVPIIPSKEYPLSYNELADYAKKERDDGGRPAFEDLGVDPTGYDIVFIGYPIWWYEMPMIMDTFFDTYDFSGVTIIPFNTHAGSRDGGTYGDIRELEPDATVLDGLAISGSDAGKDSARTSIEEWLSGLNLD